MPKRRKRSRRRKKKRGMRRRNRMTYQSLSTILAPDTMYVKLRFYNVALFAGATVGELSFRGNSVFDPNVSVGTSNQPAGFDQYAAIYSHYEVTGSAIKVQLTNLSAAPARYYVMPQVSAAVLNQYQAIEQPYCQQKVLGSINGNGNSTTTAFMRTKKLIGRSVDSVNYGASVTNNPSNQWFWHIKYSSLTLDDVFIDGQIIITYYVKFWQRKSVTDS